ncbi:zinc transporter ZIP1-like [Mizuhopecten yessoensis]|uniref:Zinc transporter ZIP1 n=1 Tax=Mizuhopecten yessoensis TaxID=6573 RepID=A0A210PFK3_MIZYE|nr:zinc transporter ZIP1-like [Mizuhopecten yessoensis]OWF35268.1 Zinc transporter ZIP1 [Mizuhopecten yessoensis]
MVDTNKIIAIFVVFGITFFFGITPIWLLKLLSNKMKNLSRLRYIISLTNCFAGGVFLGTAILHLMQESMETVAEAIPDVDFPLSGVLIGAGFFLVLAIEHTIGLVSKDDDSPFLGHGHEHGPTSHDTHGHHTRESQVASLEESSSGKTNPSLAATEESGDIIDGVRPVVYRTIGETTFSNDNTSQSPAPIVHVEDRKKKTTIIDVSGDGRSRTTKRIRTVILVIALSIHMIFEGMAIGLQDTVSNTWTLVAAISVHKAVIVFSVGMKMKEVVEGNIKIILYILYLSLVSPVGIAVGLVVTNTGVGDESIQEKSSGILQSLASGTFLYVTFFEILQKELSNGYSLQKVFFCMLGFAAMAGLKVLDTD